MEFPKEVTNFLIKYIGTPYSELDCWEVVQRFYTEIKGIDLRIASRYSDPTNKKIISRIVEVEKDNFYKVDEPRLGDIMLMRVDGVLAHVGIYLCPGKFFHTFKSTGCAIVSIYTWAKKIEGYYRWQNSE